MKKLSVGIVGSSKKENERRVPIHPDHIGKISSCLRDRIFVERDYGKPFNVGNETIKNSFAGVMEREELFEKCDIIVLAKPTEKDFPYFRKNQILWGWQHSVQGEAIAQVGIDKKMTFISWEAMFEWKNSKKGVHTFYKNNELAGYCSVLHALQLEGTTGYYGPKKHIAVISFGSVGKGAVCALQGVGFNDITLFTQRLRDSVQTPIPKKQHYQFKRAIQGNPDTIAIKDEGIEIPMAKELSKYDIIVNAILQNPNHPLTFIKNSEIDLLKSGSTIIDVSCDEKIGFGFARPTSFEHPIFTVGNNVIYYAVDHSPTYLWNSASYEISSALIPFLETVMGGADAWKKNDTINNAIGIKDGVVIDQDILSFQNRSKDYPHKKINKD